MTNGERDWGQGNLPRQQTQKRREDSEDSSDVLQKRRPPFENVQGRLMSLVMGKYVYDFFDKTVLPTPPRLPLAERQRGRWGSPNRRQQILGVSRGTHQPDDRDSLAFKNRLSRGFPSKEKKIEESCEVHQGKLKNTIDLKTSVSGLFQPTCLRPDGSSQREVLSRERQTRQTIQMIFWSRKTTSWPPTWEVSKEGPLTHSRQIVCRSSHFSSWIDAPQV